MANILTAGPLEGSFLVSEAEMWRSRDEVEVTIPAGGIPSGSLLKAGTTAADPLEVVTAVADTPVAILLFSQTRDDESEAQDKKATVIARDAEVNGNALAFPSGVTTAADKATLSAKLASAGIVVRW